MRRRTLLLGIVVALVAAGCGGDSDERQSKESYEQTLSTLGQEIGSSFQAILASTDPAEIGERVSQARIALQELADELAELSPPPEIESTHERLIEGLRAFSDDLGEAGRKLDDAGGDTAAALGALANLAGLESVKTLREVQAEFEEKGYELDVAVPGG